MTDLDHDPMHRCVLHSEALQRGVEIQALVIIIRALPARLLKNEVALRHSPRRGEQVLNRRKERPRQFPEWVSVESSRLNQPFQHAYFLRGHTHSLAKRRIEAADHVAERQETIRKALKRLEAPANAARKDEPVNWTNRHGVLDRGMNRLRSQRAGKRDEVPDVFRHRSAVHMGEIDLPAVVLDWNEQ